MASYEVRFSHAVRIVSRPSMRPTPLIQLRRIALDPANHRGMIHRQPLCSREFFHIPVTQGLALVSADAEQNNFTFKMPPLDGRYGVHRISPVSRAPIIQMLVSDHWLFLQHYRRNNP